MLFKSLSGQENERLETRDWLLYPVILSVLTTRASSSLDALCDFTASPGSKEANLALRDRMFSFSVDLWYNSWGQIIVNKPWKCHPHYFCLSHPPLNCRQSVNKENINPCRDKKLLRVCDASFIIWNHEFLKISDFLFKTDQKMHSGKRSIC